MTNGSSLSLLGAGACHALEIAAETTMQQAYEGACGTGHTQIWHGYWGLVDNEGTVRDIVNNSGAVVDHRVFNSFGEMTETVPATDFLFGYTGKLFDEATGLQNNLNRWYDSTVGRFLSQDPLGLLPDSNAYRYVGNAPMTHRDPFGQKEFDADHLDDAGRKDTIRLPGGTIVHVGQRADGSLFYWALVDGKAHYGYVIDGRFVPIVAIYDENDTGEGGFADHNDFELAANNSAGKGNSIGVGGFEDATSPQKLGKYKENSIYMLMIFDHGVPGKQELGNKVLDPKQLRELAKYVAGGGVIVLCGCKVASGEEGEKYLQDTATAIGRRVRALPSDPWGEGKVKGAYWVEFEPRQPGKPYSIRYYLRRDSRYPSWVQSPDPNDPTKGTITEYDDKTGKPKGKPYTYVKKDGKLMIYGPDKKLIKVRDDDGRIRDPNNEEKDAHGTAQTTSLRIDEGY
jgi:RHS repeat-associated protein